MKFKAKRITASLLAMASALSIMAVQVPVSAVTASDSAVIENKVGNYSVSRHWITNYSISDDTQIAKDTTIYAQKFWAYLQANDTTAYSIEPNGNTDTANGYSQRNTGNYMNATQQALLDRIFLYAYTNTPSDISDISKANSFMPQYIATQLLVWEVMVGQRDENFVKKGNGYSSCKDIISTLPSGVQNSVRGFYETYEKNIQANGKAISFGYDTEETANQDENLIKANEDNTYTFTDTNGMLENYDVTVTNGSIISKTATTLKIRVDTNKTAQLHCVANNANCTKTNWSVIDRDEAYYQTLAYIESAGAESLDFFAAVEGNATATGNLRIRIISDDGNIEGIQFTLTKKGDSSFKRTGTTDKDGYLDIYDLEPDIYTVEEKYNPDYEGSVTKKDIQVSAGVTSTTVFFNYIFNYIQHDSIRLELVSSQGEDLSGYSFNLIRFKGADTQSDVYMYDDKVTDESGYVEWDNLPDKDPKTGEQYYYEIIYPRHLSEAIESNIDLEGIALSLFDNNQVNIIINLDNLSKADSSISSLKGDADDNGEVGIGDVVAVAKYNANNLSYPLNNPLNADVNLDGTVNALDLTMLIEYNLNGGKWK